MKFYALSFDKILVRYFLMMAAVIAGVFTGQYWLAALSLPIFLSAVLGMSLNSPSEKNSSKPVRKTVPTSAQHKQAA